MQKETSRQEGLPFDMMGELIPGGFFVYRADGEEELIYYNRRMLDIFGCKTKQEFCELTGNTFRGMVHPDDYADIKERIDEQVIRSDEQRDYVEYRIIRWDGEIRRLIDYGMLINDFGGEGQVYTVFVEDVTELNRTGREEGPRDKTDLQGSADTVPAEEKKASAAEPVMEKSRAKAQEEAGEHKMRLFTKSFSRKH